MKYVKNYTRRKREEYGGWPFPFFFNSLRFIFISMLKVIDFAWGVVGWMTVGSFLGKNFSTSATDLKSIVACIGTFIIFLKSPFSFICDVRTI